MAGDQYDGMDEPPENYRPDRVTRNPDGKIRFETVRKSKQEDICRAQRIEKAIRDYPHLFGDAAADLARCLREGAAGRSPPPTLASNWFTRGVRKRILGHLWALLDDELYGFAFTFVLRPKDMAVGSEDLMATDPKQLLRRVRAHLTRRGIHKLQGWIFLTLDAEFDVNRGIWSFHAQGAAAGPIGRALKLLRKSRLYKYGSLEPHEKRMKGSSRVWTSGPLNNLPHQLTYAMKGIVFHRPTTVQPDGSLLRGKIPRRLPEPHHTQWLLWRDKWKVSDFVTCIGIRPTKTGFEYTS